MHDPTSAETLALLVRHRDGDQSALPILMQRYYPRVTRLVRVRLGPERLARAELDDYVQDVFLRILSSVDTYEKRSDAQFIDYVATLAENEIRNHARRDRTKKRGGDLARRVQEHAESSLALEVAAETTEVPLKASRREEIERADDCVALLLPQHREVIALRLYIGHEWRTVAERMGRTVEACQELLRRAMKELRSKYVQQSHSD